MSAKSPSESRLTAQQELLELLSFNLEDGRIWLHGKRMMMLDVASFTELRNELIDRLGRRSARALLTRIGYASGVRDADLIRQRWPNDYQQHAKIGQLLHRLEGIAKIVPVRVNSVPERNHFDAEYLWYHSAECDGHIVSHGLGTESACWMEVGYATGYVSRMCNQLIIFREIECRSMGSAACRVLSRPAAEWDDIDEELEYLGLPHPKGIGVGASRLKAQPAAADAPAVAVNPPGALADRPIIGRSAALVAARSLLDRVASTDATVLVTGETGVGKELFARALHQLSRRSQGPFVAVNCAAIPDTLIEAELFGVERGAFTGAQSTRPGRFERAARGTLFLDEVTSLTPAAQTKLLRALQEGEIERLGGDRMLKPDVRVVAAANVSLHDAMREGRFREDLFFRLNVFPIELPPLRERRDDIPELIDHFVRKYAQAHGRPLKRLTPRAVQSLLHYRFPGNIRELERIIERAVILADGDTADLAQVQLPGDASGDIDLLFLGPDGRLAPRTALADRSDLATSLDALAASVVAQCENGGAQGLRDIGDELLTRVMRLAAERSGGNLSAAARLIGVKRHQVEYRLKPR